MIAQGLLNKTGDRMGHMNMSGSTGSIEQIAPLGIGRKIFIHINNSNPALRENSPERAAIERAGWEVSATMDGGKGLSMCGIAGFLS